jgi:pimeloyl-ACP methyl ester carboxylesterase
MPQTFVLITGAWHGGWAWRPVAEHLRAAGHRVLTPTLPGLADGDDPAGLTLAGVVDFVVDYVEDNDLRDVVLVAHSWGGYPVTGAAPRLKDRLAKVIYWSAFVPAEGRSLLDECPPPYVGLFTSLAEASGNDTVAMPFEVWQSAFMQDAGEDVQRTVHALMVPQPMAYFRETVAPLDVAALGVPVSYVLAQDDIAMPPGEFAWAPRFPERLGLTATTTPGSHEACFTRPKELAQALLDA